MLEANPSWVIVKINVKNAYNEMKRAKVLQCQNENHHLRPIVPLIWATYRPRADIALATPGLPFADSFSEEGMQQGDGCAIAGLCLSIHQEVRQLDAELSEASGAARFDMDEGYAVGPRDVVISLERFRLAVRELGLELQESKCTCYSPDGGLEHREHRPPALPVGSATTKGGVMGYDLKIGGGPVGDDAFVRADRRPKCMKR